MISNGLETDCERERESKSNQKKKVREIASQKKKMNDSMRDRKRGEQQERQMTNNL